MIDTAALREKVLDLAIRGKLVPQDPTDEPASVLLERIHEQKLQMVREGKLKAKDVKDDTIIFKGDDNCYYEKFSDGTIKNIQDEIPFDLPDGWSWSRISSCAIINPRNNLCDDLDVSFIPMPLIDEGYNNSHSFEIRKWKDVKTGFTHFAEGDLAVAKITPCFENKKSVIFHDLKNGFGAGTTELHIVRVLQNSLNAHYILWNLKTNNFIADGVNAFSGAVGQKRIGREFIANYLLAIPPRVQQDMIVKTIDDAFAAITEIEKSSATIDSVKALLKSKILELAIQGKLVPQDENDEPANVLLERIRAERKAKLGKKYVESYIYKGDDNCYYEKVGKNSVDITESIAFEVPLKWEICRFESIVEMYTGNSINESDKAKKYIGLSDGYNYIATKDISFNHTVNYDNGVKIPYGEPKFKIAYKGDPLLCIEGGSAGRKIAILSEDVCFVNKLCVFHSLGVNKKYLYYYLQSPQFCELFKKNTSGLIGGVSINTIHTRSDTVLQRIFLTSTTTYLCLPTLWGTKALKPQEFIYEKQQANSKRLSIKS